MSITSSDDGGGAAPQFYRSVWFAFKSGSVVSSDVPSRFDEIFIFRRRL